MDDWNENKRLLRVENASFLPNLWNYMLFIYEILKWTLKNQVYKLLKVYFDNTGGRLSPAGVREPTNSADCWGLFLRPVPNQGCRLLDLYPEVTGPEAQIRLRPLWTG